MDCRESGRGPGSHALVGVGLVGSPGSDARYQSGSGRDHEPWFGVGAQSGRVGGQWFGNRGRWGIGNMAGAWGIKKAPTQACQQGGSSRAGKRSKTPLRQRLK